MELKIIDLNFITNHKIFKIWKIFIISYAVLLVYGTSEISNIGIDRLDLYKPYITIVSTIVVVSIIIVFLLNLFFFNSNRKNEGFKK